MGVSSSETGMEVVAAGERRGADLFLARVEDAASTRRLARPVPGPAPTGAAHEGVEFVALQAGVQVVEVPGREEHPAAAGGFEEVHQVVAEVVGDAIAIDLGVQRADIDHVVADEQVGAGAGIPRRHRRPRRWPDDVPRPRDGEGIRAPGRSRPRVWEDLADGAVVVDGVAEEAAAVAGDRRRWRK